MFLSSCDTSAHHCKSSAAALIGATHRRVLTPTHAQPFKHLVETLHAEILQLQRKSIRLVARLPGLQNMTVFDHLVDILLGPPSRANGIAWISAGDHNKPGTREQPLQERQILLRLETDLLEPNGGAMLLDDTVAPEGALHPSISGHHVDIDFLQIVHKTVIFSSQIVSWDCVNHHQGRGRATSASTHDKQPLGFPLAKITVIRGVHNQLSQPIGETLFEI